MSKKLARIAQRVQAEERVPALSVALHRADRPLWQLQVGGAGPESQFRIGSVTKTFTAVLVLQARDDGLLDLDDPIGRHLDLPAHGELTVRRLLSHTSGLQREPHGDVWDTLLTPDPAALDPGGDLLAPATVYEMCWPLATTDEALWSAGFGLGLRVRLLLAGRRAVRAGRGRSADPAAGRLRARAGPPGPAARGRRAGGWRAAAAHPGRGRTVVRMHWATYRFTRDQQTFAGD